MLSQLSPFEAALGGDVGLHVRLTSGSNIGVGNHFPVVLNEYRTWLLIEQRGRNLMKDRNFFCLLLYRHFILCCVFTLNIPCLL